jgi:hypothetical protein
LPEYRLKKAPELGLAHLAAAHRKVGVPDTALPAHVTVDRDVVGRVREDEVSLGTLQQPNVGGWVSRIRAEEAMRAELP